MERSRERQSLCGVRGRVMLGRYVSFALAALSFSCSTQPRSRSRATAVRASADEPSALVIPTESQRMRQGFPRWNASAMLRDAERSCARDARIVAPAVLAASADAAVDGGVDEYVPEVWIANYPLGPISTGAGFGADAHRQWDTLYEASPLLAYPRRTVCIGGGFFAQPADGATGCVSNVLLSRAVRATRVRECSRDARSVTVLVRAMVTREGWLVPIEASARSEHAAIAQCAGRALAGWAGLAHQEREGAETVLALRWTSDRCFH